ncbi:MAG: hypothetical protein GVY08_15035 [Bacteroidetes bacterium]|jgi:hypothetical protein|nr:hypothetical protein [Bacteroidota bacterium]
MKHLTKKQALELLPLVIDDEASEPEKVAFFKYIQTDQEVKKKYESLLLVKQLLKTKYSPKKAPEHLKNRISDLIEDMEWETKESSKVDNDIRPIHTDTQHQESSDDPPSIFYRLLTPARYIAAASVIFIFSLLTIELLEKSSEGQFQSIYDVEEMALSHFNTGNHVTASLATYQPTSSEHASTILQDEYSLQLRLPKIEGATLRRVFYTTFADGYTTPVLEFHQKEINETVHVFAFRVDDLEKRNKIKRDPEAVKICKSYKDYHIKNIDGKHVVSWKWGDYWYTAVSNHNGNDLIALVEPTERASDRTTESSW